MDGFTVASLAQLLQSKRWSSAVVHMRGCLPVHAEALKLWTKVQTLLLEDVERASRRWALDKRFSLLGEIQRCRVERGNRGEKQKRSERRLRKWRKALALPTQSEFKRAEHSGNKICRGLHLTNAYICAGAEHWRLTLLRAHLQVVPKACDFLSVEAKKVDFWRISSTVLHIKDSEWKLGLSNSKMTKK